MAKITGAQVKLKTGEAVKAHCFGNNAAIVCPKCKENPVLLIARPDQMGSSSRKPSRCVCETIIWMDPPAGLLKEPVKFLTVDYK